MKNELFGFSLFEDSPEPLRSYNRAVVIKNLVDRGEEEKAMEYAATFNEKEWLSIVDLQIKINNEGTEAVHKYIQSRIDWDKVA